MCAAANIPLNKSENPIMREFLLSRVVNGGGIPKGTQLQDHSLDVYELEKEELKQKIKEANVAIMVDELSDDNGCCVVDVMATILDFDKLSTSNRHIAYLLDMHFVTETNNKTVSQAVGRILRNMNTTLTIKFVHSVEAKVFDWPKRDNIDDCSPSWLISGPLEIQGSGPFRSSQLDEVQHIYQYIKRSKKR